MGLHNIAAKLMSVFATFPASGKAMFLENGSCMFAWGSARPAFGTPGYASGCVFLRLTTTGQSAFYVNLGDTTNCDFDCFVPQYGGTMVGELRLFGSPALRVGGSNTEGWVVKAINETISFAGNAALYKSLATAVPANSVILAVQANIQAALTGGGTTAKVGIGLNASDPDKYGISGTLAKNQKINNIPAYTVLSAPEQIDICSCTAAGALGDTALTVGSVRVRIVYATLENLVDA